MYNPNSVCERIYNLALSIYSHIRHHDYIGARLMVIELLDLLNKEIKDEEVANETKASS